MLTGKQRSYLKGLANPLKPLLQIGKDGVSEGFIAQLEETITVRELVKITILESCELNAKEVAQLLTEKTGCEFVQAIGRKVTLYRAAIAPENRKIEIPGMPKTKIIKAVEPEVEEQPKPYKPVSTVPVSGKAKAAPARVKPNSAKKAKEVAKERRKAATKAAGKAAGKGRPGGNSRGKAGSSSAKRPAKRG